MRVGLIVALKVLDRLFLSDVLPEDEVGVPLTLEVGAEGLDRLPRGE